MGRKKKAKEEYEAEWMGRVFGYTEIGEYSHTDERGQAYFWCTCLRCGERFGPVNLQYLKSGHTKSCGHCARNNPEKYYKEYIGKIYNELFKIVKFSHLNNDGQPYFWCECIKCGEKIEYPIRLQSFKSKVYCKHCLERAEIGKRYGHYVVKEYHHRGKNGQLYFLCKCDCGNEKVINYQCLKNGSTTKCGHCLERTEIGKRYGHYVIKEYHHRGKHRELFFLCECDCGNEKVINYQHLKSGHTTSCGCRTESKGEEKIRLMLETLGIKFEQYYRGFKDMKDKSVLECDFWLPGFNRVIEFDGELHYQEKKNFGDGIDIIQRRDQIKNQYCWDHGIDIVRIPYWELDNFTMEDLVSSRSRFLIRKEG